MLPHTIVEIGGYAYVEFSLFLDYVDKPVAHRASMQLSTDAGKSLAGLTCFREAGRTPFARFSGELRASSRAVLVVT
jgi:hypothetical protein